MRALTSVLFCAVAAMLAASQARAAYLESDYGGPTEPEVVRPRPPMPPMPPERPWRTDNEVRRLLSRVTVGEPYAYRGLAVYPLYARGLSDTGYLTLDEAVARGVLVITEYADAAVGRVWAENRSRSAILIMQGEGLSGGRQNRIVGEDVLLAPGSSSYIPVYCMEERRWTGRAEMDSAKMLAPESLRRSAAAGAAQRDVWAGVERALEAAGARSETRDLTAAMSSKAARDHASDYVERFRGIPRTGLAGVAVARWGRVTSIDIFGSEHLAREHWDGIIGSSSFELMGLREWSRVPPHPGTEDVRAILSAALDARMTRVAAPGSGERVVISGADVSGSACVWSGEAVHVSIWGSRPVAVPMPEPPRFVPRPVPQPPDWGVE